MGDWLVDSAIAGNIYTISRHREVKWTWPVPNGNLVGIRHSRISHSGDVQQWLDILGYQKKPIDRFVGTNQIDWTVLPSLPPRLRVRGESGFALNRFREYKQIWDDYTTPEGCAYRGIDFHKVWTGKNLVWDIDTEQYPMDAYVSAERIANHLTELGWHPTIVFSGSKGFHVWLTAMESESLVGENLRSVDQQDPLRALGKLYAAMAQKVAAEALGQELPLLDLSPCYRQGIIRMPYSIHSKTNQVVWPLSEEDRKKLGVFRMNNPEASAQEIAQELHPWNRGTTHITPMSQCFRRMVGSFM